jgi:hypothetical protein
MPLPGLKLTLNGLYFIDIERVDINKGEFVILPEDMEITKTSLSFIMPGKPTNPKRNPLRIVGRAGEVILNNFYPTEDVLIDCDTSDKNSDQTWGPNAIYEEADGLNPPYISDGKYAWVKGKTVDWWGTLIYWKAQGDKMILPSYDVIPATTPTNDVYLSYECYNTLPFNDGTGAHVRYAFNTAFGAGFPSAGIRLDDYVYLQGPANIVFPGVDGQPLLNQWYQVLIPLSSFGTMDGMTYKDFAEAGIKELIIQTQHNSGPQGEVNFFIDNIRIVTKLTSIIKTD